MKCTFVPRDTDYISKLAMEGDTFNFPKRGYSSLWVRGFFNDNISVPSLG